ncbi:transposon Ty3-G Gag-Pol polyprotein [Trichonephila clavipes]|nr:transposon Ty3-G Gag-Pol polyprotein [Trichonephila clavipes]
MEMAPRGVDAAVVQKDSLGVDELLFKLVTLEDQLASLRLQRKVPHQHQRSRSSSKSKRRYNPQGRYCYYHFRFGKKCLPGKCAVNQGYLSRTEKPDVNSLWIAEQTSRSSLGQKRKIPIAEEDKEKTPITILFGLYEFNTMSFGLRNAPSTFQRFITEVLYGLDFGLPYLDDVLVDSSS